MSSRRKLQIEILESVLDDIPNFLSDSNKSNLYISSIAFAYNKIGRYREAVKYADKALQINPKNGDALYIKGINLAKLEDYKNSIECFEETIKLNKTHAGAWYNKGLALSDLKLISKKYKMNKDEDRDCLQTAINLDESYKKPWHNKGYRISSSTPVQIMTDVPTSRSS